jgi:hypothetical protein
MAGLIQVDYLSTANPANGLASLASDTNLLAGWQTTVVSNTVNLCDDYLISGSIKTGTSPSSGTRIEVWAFGDIDFASTYLGGFTGSSASRSITFANLKPLLMVPICTWFLDSGVATGSVMTFANISLKGRFGYIPGHHGLWIVQSTGAALDSTAGNHVLTSTGIGWQYT